MRRRRELRRFVRLNSARWESSPTCPRRCPVGRVAMWSAQQLTVVIVRGSVGGSVWEGTGAVMGGRSGEFPGKRRGKRQCGMVAVVRRGKVPDHKTTEH